MLADLSLAQLDRPYLLIVNIPYYVDGRGSVYLNRGWHIDLARHFAYLPRLRVAAPRLPLPVAHAHLECFAGDEQRFVALPAQGSMREAVRALPRTCLTIAKAVGWAEVVHTGVAGWPYPIGWLGAVLARLRDRELVVVVESAPWRATGTAEDRKLSRRVREPVYEALARFSVESASVALFTQATYRDSLLKRPRGASYVTPATWISDEHVLDALAARARIAAKAQRPMRFAFIGRMLTEKGVMMLIDALRLLEQDKRAVAIDFIGTGELAAAIEAQLASFAHVRGQMIGQIPYDQGFFAQLDQYDAVVMPNLGDEQPRLVFDTAARAVPVIAFATDGITPHVTDGVTGVLVQPRDASALADALSRALEQREQLARMGLAALERVRPHTHLAMHRQRAALFAKHLRK